MVFVQVCYARSLSTLIVHLGHHPRQLVRKVLTKCTYIAERPNMQKNPVAVSARKRGTFHTEKWNVKRLDVRLCPFSSLDSSSPLLTGSIFGSYKRASKPFKTKAPATICNVFLQLRTVTRD